MKPLPLIMMVFALIGPTWTAEGQSSSINVPLDAEKWMTFYYVNPQPEKTFEALRAIHDEGLLQLPNAQRPLIAFFSTIFHDNPEVTTQALSRCSFLTKEEVGVLAYAFWFAETDEAESQLAILAERDKSFAPFLNSAVPSILEAEITIPNSLDMCWGHFFASGNTNYIGKIIGTLEYKNEKTDPAKILVYGSARWSLSSNCRQHKAVLKYCRSVVDTLPETAKAEVQLILDEIDGKASPSDVEDQTIEKLKQLKQANQGRVSVVQ